MLEQKCKNNVNLIPKYALQLLITVENAYPCLKMYLGSYV